MAKYHIVGIEKSGTTSLQAWLDENGHEVVRHEWLYCFDKAPEFHLEYYNDYQVLFIIRDPLSRIVSDYNYRVKNKYIEDIPIEEALEKYPEITQGSLYDYWANIWSITSPFFISLEEMSEIKGFPKLKENIQPYDYKKIVSAMDSLEKVKPVIREWTENTWNEFKNGGRIKS